MITIRRTNTYTGDIITIQRGKVRHSYDITPASRYRIYCLISNSPVSPIHTSNRSVMWIWEGYKTLQTQQRMALDAYRQIIHNMDIQPAPYCVEWVKGYVDGMQVMLHWLRINPRLLD